MKCLCHLLQVEHYFYTHTITITIYQLARVKATYTIVPSFLSASLIFLPDAGVISWSGTATAEPSFVGISCTSLEPAITPVSLATASSSSSLQQHNQFLLGYSSILEQQLEHAYSAVACSHLIIIALSMWGWLCRPSYCTTMHSYAQLLCRLLQVQTPNSQS